MHEVQSHIGLKDWTNGEDAVAVPWMAQFTRNPTPDKIVWYQDDITRSRFYWLSMGDAEPVGGTRIDATLDGQRIALGSSDVPQITVRLTNSMLDLDQPVSITANGTERFNGTVSRTIAELARSLEERGDPRLVFSAAVAIEMQYQAFARTGPAWVKDAQGRASSQPMRSRPPGRLGDREQTWRGRLSTFDRILEPS